MKDRIIFNISHKMLECSTLEGLCAYLKNNNITFGVQHGIDFSKEGISFYISWSAKNIDEMNLIKNNAIAYLDKIEKMKVFL
jgi:hypothetical protein